MFVLFLVSLIVWTHVYFEVETFQEMLKEMRSALLVTANIFFFTQSQTDEQKDYWGDASKQWHFVHFWSLAVEEQFYLIMPLILYGIYKKVHKNAN